MLIIFCRAAQLTINRLTPPRREWGAVAPGLAHTTELVRVTNQEDPNGQRDTAGSHIQGESEARI